jgi:hypothetical protein
LALSRYNLSTGLTLYLVRNELYTDKPTYEVYDRKLPLGTLLRLGRSVIVPIQDFKYLYSLFVLSFFSVLRKASAFLTLYRSQWSQVTES